MRYYYRLWCPDCYSEDEQVCFGGGTETDTTPYNTPEAAREAGYVAIWNTIWDVEVVDENGKALEEWEEKEKYGE